MIDTYNKLAADVERVQQLNIVPTILEMICRTTGMRFAAIARVTEDRWVACSVLDEIKFGLEAGGELQIETTICNEIRGTHKAVIIDNVNEDENFRDHHTPRMYGFQSYISVPIILKNGEFFGTLCSIDPEPAKLNNSHVISMFNLFADLISFHLQSVEIMERSQLTVEDLNRQLADSADENRQYRYISNHNLQEPLRKIRIFSEYLVNSTQSNDIEKAKQLALKVNSNAQQISMMIKDLSAFSELSDDDENFKLIDLNTVVRDVLKQIHKLVESKNAIINIGNLPVIEGIPSQVEQLFFHLISNALKFSKKGIPPFINITANRLIPEQVKSLALAARGLKYFEIRVADNGIGIDQSHLEKIFDIFSKLSPDEQLEGFGVGLTYCRKIVRNHGGIIKAQSEFRKGTIFSIIFPEKRN